VNRINSNISTSVVRSAGKLKEGEPYPTAFRYETYVYTDGARAWWKPGFFTPKWYLQALPIPEINKDYGLTQNPGW
jgi:hypothetical protein